MRIPILSLVFLFVALAGAVNAPPVAAQAPQEAANAIAEVAEINRMRVEAVERGDMDAILRDVADNVVVTLARSGMRIEGKAALRAYLQNLYALYPTRRGFTRHATARTFLDGQVVVANAYIDEAFADRSGAATFMTVRWSQTWVKMSGRWQLVDQHISDMPH